jgi:hypothetical protein
MMMRGHQQKPALEGDHDNRPGPQNSGRADQITNGAGHETI